MSQSNHETFDDNVTIVEDSNDSSSAQGSDQVQETDLDTFDNVAPVALKPEPKKEEVDKDSNVAMLPEQEGDKSGEEKKPEEAKKEEKPADAKKPDGEGEQEAPAKPVEGYKPTGKTIKVKNGDGYVELGADLEIPVKVDGKIQYYKLDEARNKLSGAIKVEEELSKIGQTKKSMEAERSQFQAAQQNLNGVLSKVMEALDKEDGDPFDALYYLLDVTGKNVVQYKERVVENNAKLFEKLLDMSETERRLYWKEQENEFLKKRTESKLREETEAKSMTEWNAKVDKLREARKVSEDDYVEAYEELSARGFADNVLTPEIIVDYASLRPHLAKAGEMVGPFADLMDDQKAHELVTDIAQYFRDGKMSEAAVKKMLDETFATSSTVKTLNERAVESPKPQSKVAAKSEDHIESFDDFEGAM